MSARKIPLFAALATLGMLAACATQPAAVAASDAAPEATLAQCERVTGSRIRPKDSNCAPPGYPFRSYSVEELQATGEMDLLEALRQIDPAFR